MAWETLLIKLLITAWLASVSVWDWRTGRIPNWLTAPVMLIAAGVRVYQGQWYVLLIWVLIFLIWALHIIGGGDAKLLMGLFALFPTYQFLFLFGGIVIAILVLMLLRKYWGERPGRLLRGVADRVKDGRALPTEDELKKQGQRNAWTFCLPGLIYLWFFW